MTRPDLRLDGTVIANGDAAQTYFPKAFTTRRAFPLEPGKEFIAQIVHNEAVVLLPGSATLDYPIELTIHDPTEYRLRVERPNHTNADDRDEYTANSPHSPASNSRGESR